MSVVFEKTSKCRYMYRIGVNNSLRLEQQTYYELLMYICAQEDQKQIHHLHSTRLRLGVPQQGVYTDIKKRKKERTSVANLDTQSSDISAEEISESGRSFQSLLVCGKKLLLYASLLAEGI